MTVGGTGNATGNGGNVSIVSAADITTGPSTTGGENAASFGIFAQSVGGGGGFSGSLILGDHDRIGSNVQSTSSGATGNGGSVSVNQSGSITTHGDNSVGIFAQSVGGGGGVQGTIDRSSTDSSYVGSFGGTGAAGVVDVVSSGAITTSGAAAHGIFAQFASGHNSANTETKTVNVQTSANIYATGAGAHGIHVQNIGTSAGASDISIGQNATVRGGGSAIYTNGLGGAGVLVHSDKDSTLNNLGVISAVSGVAIHSFGGGTTTVVNHGTVDGNILISNPSSSAAAPVADLTVTNSNVQPFSSIRVDNQAGGILNAGETLEVDRLRNLGQLYVGKAGTVAETRVTGDLLHDAGHLNFDIDMVNNEVDLLTVDGEATLKGAVKLNILQLGEHPSGTQNLKIIEATGGIDASEVEITPSVVAQFQLASVSGTELHLGYDVDFANTTLMQSLNDNQSELTSYFDRLYQVAELDEDLGTTLIEIVTTDEYARVLNTLGPELATFNGVAGLDRTLNFAETLFSCPNQGQGNVWVENGQCGYMIFGGSRLERDASSGASGFTQNGWKIGAGGQMLLENGLAIGAALAYDNSSLTTDAGASSDGTNFSGGLSVKRFTGNWEFGAAMYAGNGNYDNVRTAGSGTATGKQDQWVIGTELRAGYVFDQGSWFFKPRLDMGLSYFDDSSYSESGSATALNINTSSETFAYLRPAIEIGSAFQTAKGTDVRLNAAFSLTQFVGDTAFNATAGFVNVSGLVAPASWQTDIDRTKFDLSTGVTILSSNGTSFDFSAFGQVAENQRGYGGQVRVNIPF